MHFCAGKFLPATPLKGKLKRLVQRRMEGDNGAHLLVIIL